MCLRPICPLRHILLALTSVLISVSISLKVDAADTVFQKQLPNQQSIQIETHEIAYVTPSTPAPFGLVYVKPAHVYQYDFILLGPGQRKKIIWLYKFQSFPLNSFLPTDFEILDVDFQDGTLIAVYKTSSKLHGGTTYANIISNVFEADKKELPREEAQLTYDSDGRHIFISSAKVTGSVQESTLKVSLKNEDPTLNENGLLAFAWKDHKWQQVTQKEASPEKQDKR